MAFQIIHNDITKVHADVIVTLANPEVTIGAGLETAIYEAAGKSELLAARSKIGELPASTVGVTPAFRLHAKYIIHASAPYWKGGNQGEADTLRACYDKSLGEAFHLGCESIAFPLLSTGAYGFPREKAMGIAVDSFSKFLENHDMEIFLVVFGSKSASVSEKLFRGLREYVDENYLTGVEEDAAISLCALSEYEEEDDIGSCEESESKESTVPSPASIRAARSSTGAGASQRVTSAFTDREPGHDLDYYVNTADDPFCQYLQQLINKKGYKNAQVYKKANLTKQYFSKLMNGQVNPAKEKLLSISIALELNMDETKDMLMMAGYAMSPCNKVDLVVEYFIRLKKYNMFDIEIALDDLGLPTLSGY